MKIQIKNIINKPVGIDGKVLQPGKLMVVEAKPRIRYLVVNNVIEIVKKLEEKPKKKDVLVEHKRIMSHPKIVEAQNKINKKNKNKLNKYAKRKNKTIRGEN